MRIGIDANHLSVPAPTGIKNYSKNLIEELALLDKKNEYFIFVSKQVEIPKKHNFKLVVTPRILSRFKRQFFLFHFVNKYKMDIFHYLNPYGDILLNHPKIVTTVQDIDLEQVYPYSSKYFLNRLNCELTRTVVFRKTQAFIVPTFATKKELQKLQGKSENSTQVFVTPYAASKEFRPYPSPKNEKSGFLCLSDFSERKNTERIIRAFNLLPESIRTSHKLTIVSTSQKQEIKNDRLIKELNLGQFSEIANNVSTQHLAHLYNKAIGFLYPSLYEGFGLPILEAMACGCPVITSNYGAMKEVAGGAALLVNPLSVKNIYKSMLRVITEKGLKLKLVNKGLKRSKNFSWEQCAKDTLRVYEKIYNNH